MKVSFIQHCLHLLGASIIALDAIAAAPDRFARISSSSDTIYAGQTFDLTLAIYSTGANLDKAVSFSGFPPDTSLFMETFQELPLQQETLDGRMFDVRRFRTRVRAILAGKLRLTPSLQGTLIEETRSYFMVQRHLRPVPIPTEPFLLNVLPLPDNGRPGTFSGAVGVFEFSATASPLNIAPGDIVTIQMHIAGPVLPEGMTPPAILPVTGLKVYDSRLIPDESSTDLHVFRQTVVPTVPSLSCIPAISFTFFNPVARQYETRTAGPFPLTFHTEPSSQTSVYTPPTNAQPKATGSVYPPEVPCTNTTFSTRWRNLFRITPVELFHSPENTDVRMAPSTASTVLFSIQKGSVARISERWEGWLRIETGDGIGWIPLASP